MTYDTHDDNGAARVSRRRRVGAAGAALLAVAALGAACGSGGDGPGVASAGATATTTTSDAAPGSSSGGVLGGPGPSPKEEAQLLKYSQCMRGHGISDFPDPTGGGIALRGGPGLDPQDPQFQAAQAACAKDMPGADLTPAQKAAANAKALKFSQCMRAHGEPDFPDPDGQGQIRITNGSGVLDPNAPQFQQAQKACQSLGGGFQMQITAGGQGPAGGSGPGPVSSGNS